MPDSRPAISVVMIVLNGAPWIGQQLDALAAQREAPGSWEVVVADNGSTDGTQELVLARVASFPVPLRLADASAKPGVSYARNVGASAARAPALAFCDCDDEVHESWVGEATNALEKHDCVVGLNRELTDARDPRATVLNPGGLVGRGIHGCNFGVKREVYFDVGGFDESLPPYGCDDSEFSIRLLNGGYQITPALDMVLFFRRTVGLRRTLRKVYLSGIAETVVWQRHPHAFAHELKLRTVLVDLARWPGWAARQALARQLSPKRFARTGVTAWAHVVGYWGWIRSERAGIARLVFEPYDVP